ENVLHGPAARGETPAAFGRRCIPAAPHLAEKRAVGAPAADCVAPPSNIPDIAPHRAQDARWGPRSAVVAPLHRGPHGADCAPWGGTSGHLAALGATPGFHHGLYITPCRPARASCEQGRGQQQQTGARLDDALPGQKHTRTPSTIWFHGQS